jgi:beta-lactamase class A
MVRRRADASSLPPVSLRQRRSPHSGQPGHQPNRRPLRRPERELNTLPDNVIEARHWRRTPAERIPRSDPGTIRLRPSPPGPRPSDLTGHDRHLSLRPATPRLLPGSSTLNPESRRAFEQTVSPIDSRPGFSSHNPPRRSRLGPDLRRSPQVASHAPAFRQPSTSSRDYPRAGVRRPEMGLSRLPSRQQTLPVLPASSSSGRLAPSARPIQRLNPRLVSNSSPVRKPRKVHQPNRPASPFLHATRLVILGVGIGAIAGTLIAALDPAARERSEMASMLTDTAITASEINQTEPSGNEVLDGILTPSGSGRSLLSNLQVGQELMPLKTSVQEIVERSPDLTPGVFMVDLDNGNYLNINVTQRFATASMIKVPILVAFFQDVDAGKIRLDEMLTMEEQDVVGEAGELQFQPIGSEFPAIEVATLMIIISDNTATNMLIRRLGGMEALNRRFQSWGLTTTRFNDLLPDLDGTNMSTPKELVELMVMVSQGNLISLRSRDRMLGIMQRTYTNTLLPQGLASDASIAHKTGDIGSLVGDVGIVDMPSGKRYAIASIVQRPHNDDRAQEVIRQISRTVYDYFDNPQDDFQGVAEF